MFKASTDRCGDRQVGMFVEGNLLGVLSLTQMVLEVVRRRVSKVNAGSLGCPKRGANHFILEIVEFGHWVSFLVA